MFLESLKKLRTADDVIEILCNLIGKLVVNLNHTKYIMVCAIKFIIFESDSTGK